MNRLDSAKLRGVESGGAAGVGRSSAQGAEQSSHRVTGRGEEEERLEQKSVRKLTEGLSLLDGWLRLTAGPKKSARLDSLTGGTLSSCFTSRRLTLNKLFDRTTTTSLLMLCAAVLTSSF
ncbi:hypothetical protein JOB18_038965 [Solea senegalensis]|uniref:Uncharacterized protein n=1 Tax=Solea senegalensis TaxID=28829 RepID=A0AAV6RDG7_SOLSE|nr:hypothetical protein JOB18_038965 [Solea senegalensis]